jgi:hypothetical protein
LRRTVWGTIDLGIAAGKSLAGPVAFGETNNWFRWVGFDVALFPVKGEKNNRKVSLALHWGIEAGTLVNRVLTDPWPVAIYSEQHRSVSETHYGVAFFDDLNGGPGVQWQLALGADGSSSNGNSIFVGTLSVSLRSAITQRFTLIVAPSTGVIMTKGSSAIPFGFEVGALF